MTYKYRCDLEHEVEVEQKISEEPLSECPKCGVVCKRVPIVGEDANGAFSIKGFSYKNGYSRK